MRIVLLLALAPLLFLGCQKQSSAKDTARQYTDALLATDWKQACSLIEARSKETLEELYNGQCEDFIQEEVTQWLRIDSSIDLEEREASNQYASFQTSVSDSPLLLRQTEDGWRVTFFGKE